MEESELGFYYLRAGYGCTTLVEVGGRKVYEFDRETGVLQVSMSPDNLSSLQRLIGIVPEDGRDIELPSPLGYIANFKKVKSIVPMVRNHGETRFALDETFLKGLESYFGAR